MSGVFDRIHAAVALVPPGRVVTYGQIAEHLGMPNGARTVGWAMRHCPPEIPWHRVVNSRGEISRRGLGEGESLQRALLEGEGISFDERGRIDLGRYGWAAPGAPQDQTASC